MEKIGFQIESQLDAVGLLAVAVNGVCQSLGFSQVECSMIELGVVEAVNNSIQHAYQDEPGKVVTLELSVFPDCVIFDVVDSGRSADPAMMHADHSADLSVDPKHAELLSESGRGLAIIQRVMDSALYMPGAGGNRFRLCKLRRSRD